MMPKGVEHVLVFMVPAPTVTVRIPMMPKGVEHLECFFMKASRSPGENSDDAERR